MNSFVLHQTHIHNESIYRKKDHQVAAHPVKHTHPWLHLWSGIYHACCSECGTLCFPSGRSAQRLLHVETALV